MDANTQKTLFSSATEEWGTPPALFAGLNSIYGFRFDVCASEKNHLLPGYYTKEDNALTKKSWPGPWFCNPPYGRKTGQIADFAKKAVEEAERNIGVLLVPARTDTAWFGALFAASCRVWFIKGRLHYTSEGKDVGAAPFPSCILELNPNRSACSKQVDVVGTDFFGA
jgi:phage N-6-adenine-methyltransferase